MSLRFFQIDAFTRERFMGNPACVLPDAQDLSTGQMQAIARELNVSETAFVVRDDSRPEEVHVRFFTPTTEVPVCGHATIATHYVLALEGRPLGTRQQRSIAGLLPVETNIDATGSLTIWMQQRAAEFHQPLEKSRMQELLPALGLDPSDLEPGTPVQVVCTGHSKVIIPIRSRSTIARLAPDLGRLSRLSHEIGCNGYYAFTLDQPDDRHLSYGRMFAPAIGIDEDPVTGNASGCLGAYLLHHRIMQPNDCGLLTFVAGQGLEVGRPGSVQVEALQKNPSEPIAVRVGGHAVVAFRGEIELA